jgi:hypothetical protein
MQHAPITSTGPQIGYFVVVADVVIKSSERRPALALSDIAVQISRLNFDRYAAGLDLVEGPRSHSQLHPLFAGSNPQLDALLAGQQPPAARVGCSSNAFPIPEIRGKVTGAITRMAAGYNPRTPA